MELCCDAAVRAALGWALGLPTRFFTVTALFRGQRGSPGTSAARSQREVAALLPTGRIPGSERAPGCRPARWRCGTASRKPLFWKLAESPQNGAGNPELFLCGTARHTHIQTHTRTHTDAELCSRLPCGFQHGHLPGSRRKRWRNGSDGGAQKSTMGVSHVQVS